jgi:hypothetical protein
MKSSIIIVALAALAFGSCTSAYKTGQTPDDVYFSPARGDGGEEYVQTEKRDDRRYQGTDDYYEDRYLRMRANDRYRWSVLDDYYMTSPYAYNYYGSYYGNSLFSPYNNYWSWNTYYNPYCSFYGGYYGSYPYYNNNVIIIKSPANRITPPSRPIAFNPASYSSNPGNSNSRAVSNRYISTYSPRSNSGSGSRYNNSNRSNNNSLSNSMQKVFSNSNNSSSNYRSNNNNSTPSRSYTPSTTTSSSSSSSSGSSGSSSGGSRPNR